MYQDLPEKLKEKVRHYLLADDFKSAKQLHDSWMNHKQVAADSSLDLH